MQVMNITNGGPLGIKNNNSIFSGYAHVLPRLGSS
jgi:hypothetical protein